MNKQPNMRFNGELFAKDVREKRGDKPLRDLAEELTISIATLSRIENAKMPPDAHNLGILCHWLGENPLKYYVILNPESNDPMTIQLRAAQQMSAETAAAFMDLIRVAYEEILAQAGEDEKA